MSDKTSTIEAIKNILDKTDVKSRWIDIPEEKIYDIQYREITTLYGKEHDYCVGIWCEGRGRLIFTTLEDIDLDTLNELLEEIK